MADVTSIIALLVSLVALAVTLGQMLQQYAGTAEGYRRCQTEVMGLWATKTRRQFRWREFRFETTYVVPKIAITRVRRSHQHLWRTATRLSAESTHSKTMLKYGCDEEDMMEEQNCIPISGSSVSRERTMISFSKPNLDPAMVSWVPLLWTLHELQEALNAKKLDPMATTNPLLLVDQIELPTVTLQYRSWDFVPPDVVRPLAVSTVSDVAIIVRRMGMDWKTFDPDARVFRAEGDGHMISSIDLRSVGVILQYACEAEKASYWTSLPSQPVVMIPTRQSDALAFGLVVSRWSTRLEVGTEEDVLSIVSSYTRGRLRSKIALKRIMHKHGWAPGFSDILPIVARVIRLRNSSVLSVPEPTPYASSPLDKIHTFLLFRDNLATYVSQLDAQAADAETSSLTNTNVSPMAGDPGSTKVETASSRHSIQTIPSSKYWTAHDILRKCNDRFAYSDRPTLLEEERLDEIHDDCDAADLAFTNDQYGPVHVLLSVHTEEAIRLFEEIEAESEGGSSIHNPTDRATRLDGDDPDERTMMATQLMTRFWENLPNFTRLVNERWVSTIDERRMEAMWILLMYRALCWQRLHDFQPGRIIPSRYWDSKMPVYIG